MSNNMIRKASAFEILNHWVLALSFFVLMISGFGFLFHLEGLNSVFGSFNQMKAVHNYIGIVFTVSLLLTVFYYLPVSLKFSGDDITWFLKGGGYFSKKTETPPQDKLNAGQKLYYIFILIAGIAIAATGFIMWLRPPLADIRKWILISHFLHNISFDFMVIAMPFHVYLATLANPGTLRIMVYGTVPIEWAKKRHGKWVKRAE
ncbi:MAG: formate dehydrogenase subunit gamma [Nitrospirae bacterium]|nr:formate dehydrogenase subunit gamma [Nitrospirota bacterium]